MTGFPNRPVRSQFGPQFQDAYPVRDPTREVSAEKGNLAYHQVVGAGLMAPLVLALIDIDTVAVEANVEAWNKDGLVASPYDPPTVSNQGGGVYHLTYNAQYPDEGDNLVTIDIQFAVAQVQYPGTGTAQAGKVDPNTIGIQTSGLGAGAKVLVLGW